MGEVAGVFGRSPAARRRLVAEVQVRAAGRKLGA